MFRAFPSLMEHQAVKDNAVKQRVRAFPSLMEHQAIKDNAVKQRVRAKCRFCENSSCSNQVLSLVLSVFASFFCVSSARTRALRNWRFCRKASAKRFLRSFCVSGMSVLGIFMDFDPISSKKVMMRDITLRTQIETANDSSCNNKPSLALKRPLWQKPTRCCGSSVVEHTIGNGEVESSILSRSTRNL
jgi:hypothetical protein